jgi:hypothetical protein
MNMRGKIRAGVFNAWPTEPFAVARRPFWKNNYKR